VTVASPPIAGLALGTRMHVMRRCGCRPTQGEALDRIRQLSNAARLNVAGLVVTAAGMLLQIAAGSELYPSFTGPIVLLATAVIVAVGPARWTPYLGLVVPLVLGLGAIIAAVMTGEFIEQLTDVRNPGILLGSLMHVVGLLAAVAGAVGMLRGRRRVGRA
jgi:hypothetical protein